jgi:hypothetical protein
VHTRMQDFRGFQAIFSIPRAYNCVCAPRDMWFLPHGFHNLGSLSLEVYWDRLRRARRCLQRLGRLAPRGTAARVGVYASRHCPQAAGHPITIQVRLPRLVSLILAQTNPFGRSDAMAASRETG